MRRPAYFSPALRRPPASSHTSPATTSTASGGNRIEKPAAVSAAPSAYTGNAAAAWESSRRRTRPNSERDARNPSAAHASPTISPAHHEFERSATDPAPSSAPRTSAT